jgi:hypothetical protein
MHCLFSVLIINKVRYSKGLKEMLELFKNSKLFPWIKECWKSQKYRAFVSTSKENETELWQQFLYIFVIKFQEKLKCILENKLA